MDDFWFALVLIVALWYIAVTVAIVLLWKRTRPSNQDIRLSALQAEMDRLRERIQALENALRPGKTEAPSLQPRAEPVRVDETVPPPLPKLAAPASAGIGAESPPKEPAAPPIGTLSPPLPEQTRPELEAVIGGNWLLKIGILAIVLGALYFLKYAFDNEWIGNTGRVLIGVFAGIGLLYGSEVFRKKDYTLYGQALAAGGISILYLSIYAAFNFYSLIAQVPALLFMALVTAVSSLLSARYRSKPLAVMSLAGGVFTPYWLNSGQNNQVGLLSYLLILDAGIGFLARYRGWLFLNVLSLVGTVLLFGGWADRFYTRDALWTTEIFLVLFAALYLSLFESVRAFSERERAAQPARLLSAAVIILFFFSSQAILDYNAVYYWIFLFVFDVLLLAASLRAAASRIAPGLLLLNAIGIGFWFERNYSPEDRPFVWCSLCVIFALFLSQQMARRKFAHARADTGEVMVAVGTGMGYFGMSYYLLEDSYSGWMGIFALALAVVYLAAARILNTMSEEARPVALAFIGVSLTLLTLAIPIQLEQNWITIGWAAEAVVLAWVGLSSGSLRLRQSGLVVLTLSLLRLFGWDAVQPVLKYRLVFNPRFFTFLVVIAAMYVLALIYRRSSTRLASWEKGLYDPLVLAASGITVFLVSQESWTFYGEKLRELYLALQRETLREAQMRELVNETTNSRQLTWSLLWGIYAIAAVIAGILRRYRPIRLFGIALFVLAIFKVFLIDIWTLQRLHRILSVICLGVLLLVVAFLYERFKTLIFE